MFGVWAFAVLECPGLERVGRWQSGALVHANPWAYVPGVCVCGDEHICKIMWIST